MTVENRPIPEEFFADWKEREALAEGMSPATASLLAGRGGPSLQDSLASSTSAASLRASAALAGGLHSNPLAAAASMAAAAGFPSPSASMIDRSLYGGLNRLSTRSLDSLRLQMLQESMRSVTSTTSNPASILNPPTAAGLADSLSSSYLQQRSLRDAATLEHEALRRHQAMIAAQLESSMIASSRPKRGRGHDADEEDGERPSKRGNK